MERAGVPRGAGGGAAQHQRFRINKYNTPSKINMARVPYDMIVPYDMTVCVCVCWGGGVRSGCSH